MKDGKFRFIIQQKKKKAKTKLRESGSGSAAVQPGKQRRTHSNSKRQRLKKLEASLEEESAGRKADRRRTTPRNTKGESGDLRAEPEICTKNATLQFATKMTESRCRIAPEKERSYIQAVELKVDFLPSSQNYRAAFRPKVES